MSAFILLVHLILNTVPCVSKVRVPTGRLILELPAGMLDDDRGDFVGTAIREVSLCLCSQSLSEHKYIICLSA